MKGHITRGVRSPRRTEVCRVLRAAELLGDGLEDVVAFLMSKKRLFNVRLRTIPVVHTVIKSRRWGP